MATQDNVELVGEPIMYGYFYVNPCAIPSFFSKWILSITLLGYGYIYVKPPNVIILIYMIPLRRIEISSFIMLDTLAKNSWIIS